MAKPLCLVTGSCGFIGSHVVEVLSDAGFPIRATDLPWAYEADRREPGRWPSVLKRLNIDFVPADLREPDSLDRVVQDVEYCFHPGAVFNYSAPWDLLERTNVQGTRALVSRLLDQSSFKKLVMWGAGGVYDLSNPMPLTEESPTAPANDYLQTKHLAEQAVMRFGREGGLRYSIMRPTTVYGPRNVYGAYPMFAGVAGAPVAACPANFDFRIPFVHVRDVARAALFLAEQAHTDGEIYNLNDSSQMTNLEFFRFLGDVLGKPFVRLPPVNTTALRAVLTPVAKGLQWLSANVTGKPSALEADVINYLGRDFVYANEKLLATGFEFLYPDARQGIADTMLWYQQAGWL